MNSAVATTHGNHLFTGKAVVSDVVLVVRDHDLRCIASKDAIGKLVIEQLDW